jgi:hypothetical protein
MGHQLDDRQSVKSAFYNSSVATFYDSNFRVQYNHSCSPSLTHYSTWTLVFSHSLIEAQETDMNGLILFMPIISGLPVNISAIYKGIYI